MLYLITTEVAVKWEGYPAPTLEPLEHLEDTAAMQEYEATHDCPWKTSGGEGLNVMVHGILMPQALPSPVLWALPVLDLVTGTTPVRIGALGP
ncbi:hypothetical protein K3495_g11863 [Podosphaera aphanis]|nr:hypothetical protein K3495_g11863 [Podosphaera aphanis]